MPFLPDAFTAPLRLLTSDAVAEKILAAPLLFAAHYANVNAAIAWPDKAAEVRQAVRERYQRHNEVLALLEKFRGQLPIMPTAELAKRLAEGLELHHAISPQDYRRLCAAQLASLVDLEEGSREAGDLTAGARTKELSSLLGFTPAQKRLLAFALA